MNKESKARQPATKLITKQIADLADWRGELLAHVRKLILESDPDIPEEWKWDTAGWSHNGMGRVLSNCPLDECHILGKQSRRR